MSVTVIGESQDADYRKFLAAGDFRLQCCRACGHVRYPARWICPQCLGEEFDWKRLSGAGKVETFTWYMTSFDKRFTDVPYNVALVQLEEGPRLISNVRCSFGELEVDMPVTAKIERQGSSRPILVFQPSGAVAGPGA